MIERLQRALAHIEELSPAAQEDLAPGDAALPPSVTNSAGAWSDLQDDDEFAFFDRIQLTSL